MRPNELRVVCALVGCIESHGVEDIPTVEERLSHDAFQQVSTDIINAPLSVVYQPTMTHLLPTNVLFNSRRVEPSFADVSSVLLSIHSAVASYSLDRFSVALCCLLYNVILLECFHAIAYLMLLYRPIYFLVSTRVFYYYY